MEEIKNEENFAEAGEAGPAGKLGETGEEQITAEPTKPLKIKDPKRIEAGKKLAAYNKNAKSKQKLQANEAMKEETASTPSSWIPEFNITLIVALVGLAFTAGDLFLRYKESIAMTKIEPAKIIPSIIINPDPKRLGME